MDRVDDKPAVLDQEGIIQAQLLLHGGVGFLGVVVAQHHLHRVAGGEAQDRIDDEADTQQHRNQHEQPFENKTVHLSLSFFHNANSRKRTAAFAAARSLECLNALIQNRCR
ncbi:Uncharacterised protein [uncultured Blautia sp.]|nr:Uncharacterised protein [uncultured Blautia sp.]